MVRTSPILDSAGKPFTHANGKPRQELIEAFNNQHPRRARANYDAARDTAEYQRHWANADSLDSDSANNQATRHKLIHRSRYEQGSNGYYAGIIETHVNMVVGVGPTLRMLTSDKDFNNLVERQFYLWTQRVRLGQKLWCMHHARTQDGEAFAILQTNPAYINRQVSLDIALIEAEQCQTPFIPFAERGYIDGIRFDEHNNVLWYDVLPEHPGSANQFLNTTKPIRVEPRNMLHWFKLRRPGEHRSVPAMTSTLNLGASSRRMREATLRKVEIEADYTVFLKTMFPPNELDEIEPMSTLQMEKGMLTALPNNLDPVQLNAGTPNAQYADFNRSTISESASPLSMPFNVAAHDSSTYSFASGKLDTLCYRAALDVERRDCNDLVLDPMFAEWWREWTIVFSRRDTPPPHQWDWPAHPVIDVVAEASATDTELKNGTISVRDVYTKKSKDFEDELSVMAEDAFGDSSQASIEKMRQIVALKNTPAHAIDYVATLMGIELPQVKQDSPQGASAALSHLDIRKLKTQLATVEAL